MNRDLLEVARLNLQNLGNTQPTDDQVRDEAQRLMLLNDPRRGERMGRRAP